MKNTSTDSRSPHLGCILIQPQDGRALAVDSQAEVVFRLDREKLDGVCLETLFPEMPAATRVELLGSGHGEFRTLFTAIQVSQGDATKVAIHATNLHGSTGRQLLLTIQDVTDEQELSTTRDALTGLPDRRALVNHFQKLRRTGNESTLKIAVLFMDLDHFKKINDDYGHVMGDRVLTTLAQRWQACLREGDLVARYGGDEFIVLLGGVNNLEQVKAVISRLQTATEEPITELERQTVRVTIGLALAEADSADLDELLVVADRDMYALKQAKPG